MKTPRIIDAMNHIDEDLLSASQAVTPKKKTIPFIKRVVIVACICLLVGSVTVLASEPLRNKILGFFIINEETVAEYGYEMLLSWEKIPAKELSTRLRTEARKALLKQYEETSPSSAWFPGHWQQTFASRKDAYAYINLSRMKEIVPDLPEQATTLNVGGNNKGHILFINLESSYVQGDIRLQFITQLYTEYTHMTHIGVRFEEDVVFEESVYTTENGLEFTIVSNSPLESGYLGMDAYYVIDDICYNLHIAYQEKDKEEALRLMHAWADLF